MNDYIPGAYFSPIPVPWTCASYPSPACVLIAARFYDNLGSEFYLDATVPYGKQCDLIQLNRVQVCARGLFVTDKLEVAQRVLHAFNGNLDRMRIQGHKEVHFIQDYGDGGAFKESYRPQKFWVLHPDDMDKWDAHPAETAFVSEDKLRCMTQWHRAQLIDMRGNYTKAWYEGRFG